MGRLAGIRLAAALWVVGIQACVPDPPDTGFLVIAVESTPFAGIDGVTVLNERVEVILRSDQFDPSTEQRIVLGDRPQVLSIPVGLGGSTPRGVALYQVPPGFVAQVRFINSQVFARFDGAPAAESVEIEAPSGEQTGLKVIPVDGVPFPIEVDHVTVINVLFDPDRQLVFNPVRTHIKPTIPAELISVDDLAPDSIMEHQAVVQFVAGTTEADIASVNAAFGATMVHRSQINPLRIVISAPGRATEDLLRDYRAEPRVLAAVLRIAGRPDRVPDDLNPLQDNLNNTGANGGTVDADIDAVEAWDITTGGTEVLVASIDTGVHLNHPDIIDNIFINQGELPPALFDVSPRDGRVQQSDIDALDIDGDRRITFRDLNSTVFALNAPGACLGGRPPLDCDADGDGLVTPLDLVQGDPGATPAGFEDGINNDESAGNVLTDDLVGWDLFFNDNLPEERFNSHGTASAGVIGARGNNGSSPLIPADRRMSGIMWNASIIPINIIDDARGQAPSELFYDAIELAAMYGAPVAQISIGWGPVSSNAPLDPDRALEELRYQTMLFDAARGEEVLLVASTGNLGRNLDEAEWLELPAEIDRSTIITVSSVDTNDNKVAFANFGSSSVDLVAPGFAVLSLFDPSIRLTEFAQGSSIAAPHVAGVAGLMYQVRPTLTPTEARQIIMDSVDDLGLADRIRSGGRLNAFRALDAL